MPVRIYHDQNSNSFYFVTFTCYKWLQLFKVAEAYDTVYKWFDHLYRNNCSVVGYVIMPNHVHVLLYFSEMTKSLNSIISNAKRFMAYEIINRLKQRDHDHILDILSMGVKEKEERRVKCIKCLKKALMQRNVLAKSLSFKSFLIFI